MLVRELAAQQDDGAQVLHRDGEPQLRDQAAAPGERFERGARDEHHAGDDERHGEREREHVEALLSPAPQAEAAVEIAGSGDVGGDGGRLPADAGDADERGEQQRDAQRVGHERGAHPQQRGVEAEQPAGHEPGDRGAGQASPGELGETRGDAGTGERGAAQPLHRGADERGAARHRGEHHVGDVGGLERERSALGAAAQSRHEREDGDHPEHGRAVLRDVRGLRGAELGVAHHVAEPEQDDAAEQADDVHLVGGVEPLHVAEAVPLAGGPQGVHRRGAGAGRPRRRRL